MTGTEWSRFWSKVSIGDGCWTWTASTHHTGYGQISTNTGAPARAHRVAYELWHGVSPGKLHVCHTCDNPPCVRPSHLWLGTNQENADDMVAKGRMPKGEEHHNSKLKENQVKQIRERYGNGETQTALAAEFGVARTTVCLIVALKRWGHL